MRVLYFLLGGLIVLTRPDGSPVWVHPDAALRVEPETSAGAINSNTRISGHSGVFWVKETPEEVVRLLREAE